METKTIQISAGKGQAECTYVVAKVLQLFLKELNYNAIEYTILNREKGIENGTVQSVSLQIEGIQLVDFLQQWLGTIKWIGASNFRKYNKRKNWFIGCFEVENSSSININENEIQFQAIRSSGAGGQHVNKVSSATRAKHTRTGLQVLVMDSRSQHQNKKIAIKRLQEKVAEFNVDQLKEQIKNEWENHQQLERGNPVRVFIGTDFKSVQKDKLFKKKRNHLKNDLRKQ